MLFISHFNLSPGGRMIIRSFSSNFNNVLRLNMKKLIKYEKIDFFIFNQGKNKSNNILFLFFLNVTNS